MSRLPTAVETAGQETPFGWLVVVASVALIAVGNGANFVSIVSLKAIAAEFDWPRAIPALAYSLVMLGAGIGGVYIGRWTDRAGMVAPLTMGVLMLGAGCVLTGYATGAVTFLLAQGVCLGLLGNAALYGPLVANVTRWFDRRRGLAVAMVATGQALAGAFWTPVFRAAADSIGWRDTYLYFGIFLTITLLPLVLVFRRRPPAHAASAPGPAGAGSSRPIIYMSAKVVLVLLCVAIVGCCVSMSMPLVHLVSHVSDLGFGLDTGAMTLSVALACAFVSRLAWGWISDRIGGLPTLLITSIWQASALFAMAVVESMAGLFAVAAYFGLGYGGIVPAYALIAREFFPAGHAGQTIGVVVLFGTIGMALGSWMAGAIHDITGTYMDAFLVGYGFNLLNIAIVFFLMSRWQNRPRAGTRRASIAQPRAA